MIEFLFGRKVGGGSVEQRPCLAELVLGNRVL